MQNVDYIPQTRTHYDPTQRAAQWKQRVVHEEDTLASGVPAPASARSRGASGQRGSAGICDVLPGPGSTLGGRVSSSRRPDIPELTQIRDGLRSSRSSMASSRYTGRSTARSGASELSTFRSIGSNCSNLTEVALGRIERLEASLDAEKRRRQKAEMEISQLRELVTGGSTARSAARSARSGRSATARSGRSSARSTQR